MLNKKTSYELFKKRREPYLSLSDHFKYTPASAKVTPFGSDSVARRNIITASGAANVVGRGYVSRAVYAQHLISGGVKKTEADTFLQSAMEHGKRNEATAARAFFEWMSYSWEPIGDVDDQLTYTISLKNLNLFEPEKEKEIIIGATPDLLIWNPIKRKIALLEIKCPYRAYLSGYDLSDYEQGCTMLSDKHYIQSQLQMLVLKIPEVYLFFYVPMLNGINACCWLIREDQAFHKFLLSNIFQLYKEIRNHNNDVFKLYRSEGQHNTTVIHESKMEHSTFLIP